MLRIWPAFAFILSIGLSIISLLEAAETTVIVEKIRPQKVLYDYNDTATANILLKNKTEEKQPVNLIVNEERSIKEIREIWKVEVELDGGESRELQVSWNVGDEMFGRSVTALLFQDEKEISRAAEFFQVTDPGDFLRTMIINTGLYVEVLAGAMNKNPFLTYQNYDNHFGYGLSGFTHLAPKEDEWITGQNRYHRVKKDLLTQIETARRKGRKSGGYTFLATAGPAGYEFARKRPDWFVRDRKGAFNAGLTRLVDPVELSYGTGRRISSWYALIPDLSNPDVVRYGAEEVVRAIDMFSFDAFFFDSVYGYHQWHQQADSIFTYCGKEISREKADSLSLKSVIKTRDIIRKAHPDVGLWYNQSTPFAGTLPREANRESLRDTHVGTLREYQSGQLANPVHPNNRWRSLYEELIAEKIFLAAEGFEHVPLSLGYINLLYGIPASDTEETRAMRAARRYGWTVANHLGAIMLAARVHPCVTESTGFRAIAQFMTRYSEFIWAEDIKPVKNSFTRITVESNREVWWEEAVYEREKGGYKDTYIHFVNSPEEETVDFAEEKDPTPAKYVEVEYLVDGSAENIECWILQPYSYDCLEKVPVKEQIIPEAHGNKIFIELPQFTYYALLIIREK